MTRIYTQEQIETALKTIDAVAVMEQAFTTYSAGQMTVTPMGEIAFKTPPGQMKITCGYLKKDEYYIVESHSEFPQNAKKNMAPGSGNVILYDRLSGHAVAAFMDDGYLRAIRTAAAGAVAAKLLAPKKVKKIGIFGTGLQARLQLIYLKNITDCRDVMVFGRNVSHAQAYAEEMNSQGFNVEVTESEYDIAEQCNLIVTATASQMPLLTADMIQPGTHITAVGATTPQKIELAPLVLKNADIVVVDSLEESKKRGEAYHAVQTGLLKQNTVLELGKVLATPQKGRKSQDEVTVADLTGLVVQDLEMAKAIHLSQIG